jgi:hypothetical protein
MNKYNVGQAVYWIKESGEVYDDMFVIQRVSIDNLGYHYSLVSSTEDIIDWCREEDVFIDKKNAELESRKRNALERIGVK